MVRKYPAVVLLAGVVIGIVAADLFRIPAFLILIATLIVAAASYIFYQRNSATAAAISLLLALSGVAAFRFAIDVYDTGPRHFTNICGEGVRYQLFGTVVDWPDIRASRTNIVVQMDSVGMGLYRKTEGNVLIAVSDTGNLIQRGDRIEWYGQFLSPKRGGLDRFDYRRYLNLKGIAAIVYLPTFIDIRVESRNEPGILSAVDNLREWIVATLWSTLTPSAAALAQGFLIGETRHIPQEIYALFRDTGTLHVLAVSGSNVGLVILFLYFALFPLPLRPVVRSAILIGAIILFGMVSYGEPSVVRASLMAILIVAARLAERRVDLNQIVALTALIILLWQPSQFFDVGFQLSFATAWGIVFVMSLIEKSRSGRVRTQFYYWVVIPVVVSLVAQIFSAPLTAYYFGRVPAISILANITVVPLISIATIGTLCVLAGAFLLPVLGQFLGGLLSPLMAGILALLSWFGSFQWPMDIGDDLSPALVVFLYAVVVVGIASIWFRPPRRLLVFLLIIGANVMALSAMYGQATAPSRTPVAYASTIPGGVMVIVPRGLSADVILSGSEETSYPIVERIIMPAFRSRQITHIERLVIHRADVGALEGLLLLPESIPVDTILYPSHLKNAVADIMEMRDESTGSQRPALVTFGETLPSSSHERMLISSEKVILPFGGRRIVVVAEPIAGAAIDGLMIFSGQSLVSDEVELFHKETDAQVVCAELVQKDGVQTFRRKEELAAERESWLYILSEKGGAKIVPASFDSSSWLVIPAE